MPRLVAFGCSYTFGFGLADVWLFHAGYKCSINAWPNKLGELLGYEVVNKGWPGSGQQEIFNIITNFDFKPDDLCVIMWTHFDRLDFFKYTSPKKGERIDKEHKSYRNYVMLTDKYQSDITKRNWDIIQHTSLLMRHKGITSFSLVASDDLLTRQEHPIEIPGFLENVTWTREDYAHDTLHPGEKSHSILADAIYAEIKEKV